MNIISPFFHDSKLTRCFLTKKKYNLFRKRLTHEMFYGESMFSSHITQTKQSKLEIA